MLSKILARFQSWLICYNFLIGGKLHVPAPIGALTLNLFCTKVSRVLSEFHAAGKPQALCCIAPILAAKVLGKVISFSCVSVFLSLGNLEKLSLYDLIEYYDVTLTPEN